MARYHFNVSDGHGLVLDAEGLELSDPLQAEDEAVAAIRDLLVAGDRKGKCRRHWRMDVVDEAGRTVVSLPFGHAMQSDLVMAASGRHDGNLVSPASDRPGY